jgi:hypothetical protein
MQRLDLGHNQLTGSCPPQWTGMASIQVLLCLASCYMHPLSYGYARLLDTQSAAMRHVALTTPPCCCTQEISMPGNALGPSLPSTWAAMPTSLQRLDLGSNSFAGMLPPAWGDLRALAHLNASRNQLSGARAWPCLPAWAGLWLWLPGSHYRGMPCHYTANIVLRTAPC